jgi:uncharacterized membrane protein
MSTVGEPAARPRRRYIDWARGLAVLIMIEAHALDAWTRPASRQGDAFAWLSMLGGFAAPLFLFLAGLSLVLAAERFLERGGSRRAATEAAIKRAAEIFILAFLFRIQAFVISPGSWLITVFRVDILNVMGVALAAAALAWGVARGRRSAVFACALAATVIAMVTPLIREAAWVDRLPLWVQWHLRPFGDHTTFTLFPWAGFAMAGAAAGALLADAGSWLSSRSATGERRLLAAFGVAGAALLALGLYTATLPAIYQASSFWTSSPTFFAIRVGILLIGLSLLFAAGEWLRASTPGLGIVETFGRNSLFIYWIHVELVYGYATWVLRHRLPLWGTELAFLAFAALMFRAIRWRNRAVDAWKSRAIRTSTAGAVPA